VGYVIAIIVVLVIAIGAFAVVRHRSAGPREPVTAAETPRPEPAPMTGLESALAQVTDRDGHPIRDRIEAESKHVDDLRVPDDTGPLLRRALDHVEQPAERAAPRPADTPADSAVEPHLRPPDAADESLGAE
jgi:hypothetical protein